MASDLSIVPAHLVDADRRAFLRGALAVGVTAVAGSTLAACAGGPRASGGAGAQAPPAPGTSLGSTTDVPVGGGKIYISPAVVVTQPTVGTFRAFSSRCTHAGCPVTKVDDGLISCPCHGSQFSISDGSVIRPPAEEPLSPIAITVTGDTLTVA